MESAIIIPVYNNVSFLKKCIASISNQTYKNFKVILVDDGSEEDVLDEIKLPNNNLIYVKKKNEGAGKAREYGLGFLDIDTKYVFFIDSDDYIDSNYLEIMVRYMKNYKLDFCQCSWMKESNTDSSIYPYPKEDEIIEGDKIKRFIAEMFGSLPDKYDIQKQCVALWACCFSADIIKKANLHFQSERNVLSEDTIFKIDYLKHCKKIGLFTFSGYHYLISEASLTNKEYKNKSEIINNFSKELIKRWEDIFSNNDYQRIYRKVLMYFNNDILKICKSSINFKEKKKEIKNIVENPLYRKSICELDIFKLNLKNMIFHLLTKHKMYYLIVKVGEFYGK